MKECYHTTKTSFLSSILKNGLQPIYGENSYMTADSRTGKTSYSVGKQGTVVTFGVFNRFYNSVLDGNINEESFREKLSAEELAKHQNSVENIKNASSFEDWIKDNLYLCFDGNYLSEKNEDKPEDAHTTQTIPPEQIKVCVIKSIKDDKIYSYSMLDVYSCFFAKDKELKKGMCTYRFQDNIDKFQSDEYVLEYMDLEHFCEIFPELLEDNSSKKQDKISTRDIGKRSIKAATTDKSIVTKIFENLIKRTRETEFQKNDR